MIAFNKEGRKAAIEMAIKYRENGINIETGFTVGSFEKCISRMKEMDYESLLYFKDGEHITYARNTEEHGIITADILKSDIVVPGKEEKK